MPEWRVVVHLYNAGSVSIREIQARVGMDKSKVSRAATRLKKSGHITKEKNADDRRLLKLALTTKGHALMKQIIPLANNFEDRLTQRLGTNDKPFRAMLAAFLKANI